MNQQNQLPGQQQQQLLQQLLQQHPQLQQPQPPGPLIAHHAMNGRMLPQQQQQQHPRFHPQAKVVSTITPEILASLTPQQIQQFRSHPQFQEIMRNYMNRHALETSPPPGIQAQQNINGLHNGPQSIPQNIPPPSSAPAHAYPAAHLPHLQLQTLPYAVNHPVYHPPHQSAYNDNAHPLPPRHVSASSAPGIPRNVVVPLGHHQQVNPLAPPSRVVPHVGPSVDLSPQPTLPSFHYWLDKLRAENKPVPLDISLYETLITRDAKYEVSARSHAMANKALIDRMHRDSLAYGHIKQLRMNSINASFKHHMSNSIWGEGYQGYGNGITCTATKLVMPPRDRTDAQINEPVLERINSTPELVPIRLDYEQERDRFKLRDTFVWDRHESGLSLEGFVKQMLEDYKFIDTGLVQWEPVAASIQEQINEYQSRPFTTPIGELRIPIKVNITINNAQLTDQFEWDVFHYRENDPEEFATVLCDEMALPGDFCTAVAHTIREQVQVYMKALNTAGYSFDGLSIPEDEIRSRALPLLCKRGFNKKSDSNTEDNDEEEVKGDVSTTYSDEYYSILRNPNNVGDFGPTLVRLTRMEVERLDKEIERDSRRKRRHVMTDHDGLGGGGERGISGGNGGGGGGGGGGAAGSSNFGGNGISGRSTASSRRMALYAGRGGPAAPELSDVPKTFRLPYCSSVLPGGISFGVPNVHEYVNVFAQKTRISNPDYGPPPGSLERSRVWSHYDPMAGTYLLKLKVNMPRY